MSFFLNQPLHKEPHEALWSYISRCFPGISWTLAPSCSMWIQCNLALTPSVFAQVRVWFVTTFYLRSFLLHPSWPSPAMMKLLDLLMITNSLLQHSCHMFSTTDGPSWTQDSFRSSDCTVPTTSPCYTEGLSFCWRGVTSFLLSIYSKQCSPQPFSHLLKSIVTSLEHQASAYCHGLHIWLPH